MKSEQHSAGVVRRSRSGVAGVVAGALILALTACSPPGASQNSTQPSAVSTDIGSAPVELTIMTSSDNVDRITPLTKEFTAQHPNVTFSIKSDAFANLQVNAPRIMAGADAPDLMYLPTLGNVVKNRLILNLGPYATAYGWDKFPTTQLQQMRVKSDGVTRGSGDLYGMGMGFTVTGLYMNLANAQKAGISSAPATAAELQADLEKAKAAGQVPLVTPGKDGGVFFVYQSLLMGLGKTKDVTNWIFDAPGADIKSPEAVKAAGTLQDWATKGYLPADVNALDSTAALTRFTGGTGVFFSSGNWGATPVWAALGKDVTFIPFGGADAKSAVGLSDPVQYVIPTKAKHADAAAGFMNWVNSDAKARGLVLSSLGLVPGGQAAYIQAPSALASETVKTFNVIAAAKGLAPFMGNATSSMFSDTLTPQLQLLLGSKTTPDDFVAKLQSDYMSQLGR